MTNEDLIKLFDFDKLKQDFDEMFLNVNEINSKIPELEDETLQLEDETLQLEDETLQLQLETITLEDETILTDTEILIDLITDQNQLLSNIDDKILTTEENQDNQKLNADIYANLYFTNIILVIFFMFYIVRYFFNGLFRHI